MEKSSNHAATLKDAIQRTHELLSRGEARWKAIDQAGKDFSLSPKDQDWLENNIPRPRRTAIQTAAETLKTLFKNKAVPATSVEETFVRIIIAAAAYWADSAADDFCIHSVKNERIIFGKFNRLIWTAAEGFHPDRSCCDERFLQRCASLGALPGRDGDLTISIIPAILGA